MKTKPINQPEKGDCICGEKNVTFNGHKCKNNEFPNNPPVKVEFGYYGSGSSITQMVTM